LIRPDNPVSRNDRLQSFPSGRFTTENVPLVQIIEFAYQLKPEQLEGLPAWVKSRKYTIDAVPPPGIPKLTAYQKEEMVRGMVRSLLADRFKLRAHRLTKRLSVYEIVIAKGGPKLRQANRVDFARAGRVYNSRSTGMSSGNGRINALGAPISLLALVLSKQLGRPVIDKTGLTGRYDFSLTWTPWLRGSSPTNSSWNAGVTAPASSGPSIFTAIQQQLGLKLKPAKGPVEVLVVDHVEPPSPN
jgi:uncharacterized protein (TIGR03435 family)